jgi:uncharacterized protein YlxW (UPF0749 family)
MKEEDQAMDKKIVTFILISTFIILSFILTYAATGFSAEVYQVAGEGETSKVQQLQEEAARLREEATKLRDEAKELRDEATMLREYRNEDQAMGLEVRAMQLEAEAHNLLFKAEELLRKSRLEEREKER